MVDLREAEKTYDRTRYELNRRNAAALGDIFDLSSQEVQSILGIAVDLDRNYWAGYARKTLPGLLDKWGNVSAVAALQHYEDARNAWGKVMVARTVAADPYNSRTMVAGGKVVTLEPGESLTVFDPRNLTVNDSARRERKFAAKVVQGRIYQARIANMDPEKLVDEVVNQAMAAWVRGGSPAGTSEAANAMTRQIGAYYRDTMLYNAGLDQNVAGVQRVAHIGSCAWCKTLAVGGVGRAGRTVMDYALHFHDHCKCSIETLFAGDKPLRPDYYDQIEADLKKARSKNVRQELRANGDITRDVGLGSTNEELASQVQALRAIEKKRTK